MIKLMPQALSRYLPSRKPAAGPAPQAAASLPAITVAQPATAPAPARRDKPRSGLWKRLKPLVRPWSLPGDWPRTADMSDSELASEARAQRQLLRATGWYDSAMRHPFLMNCQYIRVCQLGGLIPMKPYIVLYAMALGMALLFAVVAGVQVAATSDASYSSSIPWPAGAAIGFAVGLAIGLAGGFVSAAVMQFQTAYAKAWFYEPEVVPCDICGKTGTPAGGEDGADAVTCRSCQGEGEVETMVAKEGGLEYVLRLATIDNPNIVYTGSGASAGFSQGNLFLKAPKGVSIAELDCSNGLCAWASAHGQYVGENDRETRNKYSDAEEAGKRSLWRSKKSLYQHLREWPGLMMLIVAFIGCIVFYTAQGNEEAPGAPPAPAPAPYVTPSEDAPAGGGAPR